MPISVSVSAKPNEASAFLRDGVHLHIVAQLDHGSVSLYNRMTPIDARQLAVQLCAAADAVEKANPDA